MSVVGGAIGAPAPEPGSSPAAVGGEPVEQCVAGACLTVLVHAKEAIAVVTDDG